MSQGGPGLPNMGIYRTKWFTKEHEMYQPDVPALDHHGDRTEDEMAQDKYYWIDNWPIPVQWQGGLFQQPLWDTAARQFGAGALEMGPVLFGSRRMVFHPENAWHAGPLHVLDFDPAYFMSTPIDDSMTDAEKRAVAHENSRRQHASSISVKLAASTVLQRKVLNPENRRDGVMDAVDESPDTEDEDDDETPPACPRWEEIKNYLFDTCGPRQLAWDTMTFDIPEWTLYRYIEGHGGLDITPMEWHEFLVVAHSKQELFRFVILELK